MKTSQILVAIVAPQEPVRLRWLPDTLEARCEIVDGLIEEFPLDILGTIGLWNDEAIARDLPECRFVHSVGSTVRGTFLIVGKSSDGRYISLTRPQVEQLPRWFGRVENRELLAHTPTPGYRPPTLRLVVDGSEFDDSDPFGEAEQEMEEPTRRFFSNIVWEHECDSDYYTGATITTGQSRTMPSPCVYAVHRAGDPVCTDDGEADANLVCSCINEDGQGSDMMAFYIVEALNTGTLHVAPQLADVCRDTEALLADLTDTTRPKVKGDEERMHHVLEQVRLLLEHVREPQDAAPVIR